MRRVFPALVFPVLLLAQPVRIGLALSGGAALGLAHIGVLKVLEEEGIDFVGIAGNSMGALVGGVYAAGYSAAQLESIALSVDWAHLFSSHPTFGMQYLPERQQAQRYLLQLRHRKFIPYLPAGLIPLQNVEFLLNRLLAEVEFHTGYDFDSLPVPYRAVAVNWRTGERVILRSGRVEQAIRASIAIPGVFAPEVIDGVQLVDGGVMEYLPVEPVFEFKPDFVIAVLTMRRGEATGGSLIDVASRSIDLMGYSRMEEEKRRADLVIQPDVARFLHSDFSRARELIAAGESAARAMLPLIRENLKGRVPVAQRREVKMRPLPRVAGVKFDGLKRTRQSLLSALIRTRPGKPLDFTVLVEDLERLFSTGLFEDVNYRLSFPAPESVYVIFEVSERPYGFYALGLRYDTYDNVVVGGEVGEENLWGTGATVRAAGVVGNPNEFRLGLTGTRVFRLPFGYRFDGFLGREARTCWQNGKFASSYFLYYTGGVAEMGYILGRDGFFNLGFKAERLTYRGLAVDTLRPEFIAGPVFDLQFNSQDDIHLPTRGLAYRLNIFYSGFRLDCAREFLRFEFTGEQMLPLTSLLGLALRGGVGFSIGAMGFADYFRNRSELTGFAPDEWTKPRRLFLGAGLRIRSLEIARYPVYLELRGNAAGFSVPATLSGTGLLAELHWGAGGALLANTPFGPLRIEVGVGDFFKPPPHPGGVRVFIALGREFRYQR